MQVWSVLDRRPYDSIEAYRPSELWEVFQRVLRITTADCMDVGLTRELTDIPYGKFSPPRNHYLYQAHFWPLDDLIADAELKGLDALFGTELDIKEKGFLLRLSFSVYHLFEQLMTNFGEQSAVVKTQMAGSRFFSESDLPELGSYKKFLSQIIAQPGGVQ